MTEDNRSIISCDECGKEWSCKSKNIQKSKLKHQRKCRGTRLAMSQYLNSEYEEVQEQLQKDSKTTTSYSGTTTSSIVKKCHMHDAETFEYGKGQLSLGCGADIKQIICDLIINLGNTSIDPVKYLRNNVDPKVKNLIPNIDALNQEVPVINLNWSDGSILAIPDVIIDDIHNAIYEQGKHIAICCTAGHGRTGTLVAQMFGRIYGRDAVKNLRKVYCTEAVETSVQINYLLSKGFAQPSDQGSIAAGGYYSSYAK